MKLISIKSVIILSMVFISSKASSQICFVKEWPNPGQNLFWHFIELSDSTFLLGGTQIPGGGVWPTAVIMRCNKYGDSIYTLRYDSSKIGGMALLNDSEIVVTGLITHPSAVNIAKVNFITGNTSYQNIYPCSYGTGYLHHCTDNGFVMLNYSGANFTYLKVDSNYNMQWHKYSNMSYDAYQIKPDPLGGYVAVGNLGFVSTPYGVQRLDSAGNIVWFYGYGDVPFAAYNDVFSATDVLISPDSNYIVSCERFNKTFLKINSTNGDTIWTRDYPNKEARMINNAGNDTYITVTDSFGLIDGNGNFIWQTPIVPTNFSARYCAKTLDGGYAFCGTYINYSAMVFVKLDSLGNTVNTAVYDIASGRQLRFYPNPASDVLNFAQQHITGKSFTFSIYNLFGSKVCSVTNKTSIDISELTPGVYVAEVSSDSYRKGEKVTREKFVNE